MNEKVKAVDEDIAARLLTTDDVAVAEGVAVLARAQGDAGLGAQDLLQIGLAGIEDRLLGDHIDRGRRLGKRPGAAFIA